MAAIASALMGATTMVFAKVSGVKILVIVQMIVDVRLVLIGMVSYVLEQLVVMV